MGDAKPNDHDHPALCHDVPVTASCPDCHWHVNMCHC